MADIDDLNIKPIKSWKEFEAELAKIGEEYRATIELECEAFDVDPAASDARRERSIFDYKFFCRTYFPHYVPTDEFSIFHEYVFEEFPKAIDSEEDAKNVDQAPRGEAKSTYETQLGTLWCICRADYIAELIRNKKLPKKARKHMIGIIMNTEEQSADMLESIKAELDTNPRLAMDFPLATGRGPTWQSTTIITANGIKIRIGGTGKKIRGMKNGPHRPDLIFLDDLENDEEVRNKAQRDKVEKFVLSAVLGLAGPAGGMDVFWVGTSLHYDAAINRVSRAPGWRRKVFKAITKWPDNMQLWEQWEQIYIGGSTDEERAMAKVEALAFYKTNELAMNVGAVVSWPGVRPLYRLMCMRAVNHQSFNQEQQNEAGNDESAPFKSLQFWVNRLAEWLFFGALDPSLGKKGTGRDPSARLVGGLNRTTMVLDIVEARVSRMVPDLIIADLIDVQKEYNCIAWAIETIQFQAFLYTEIIKRAALAGIPFPAVAVTPHTDKDLRIMSLQPYIGNGQVRSHKNHTTLNEQILYYPEADHDDGPDALEMLKSIAFEYGGEWSYTPGGTFRTHRRNTSRSYGDDYMDD